LKDKTEYGETAFEIVALGDNQNLKELFNKILNKATRSYLESKTEKCMNEKKIFPKKKKEEKENEENKEEGSDLWPKYSYRLAHKKHLTKNILEYLLWNDNETVDKFNQKQQNRMKEYLAKPNTRTTKNKCASKILYIKDQEILRMLQDYRFYY